MLLLYRTKTAATLLLLLLQPHCNHCCNCCCTATSAVTQPYRLYGVGSGQKVTRAVPLCTSLSVAACTACTACAQKAFWRIICPPYLTNTLRSGDRSHAVLGFLLSLQVPSQTPSLLVL